VDVEQNDVGSVGAFAVYRYAVSLTRPRMSATGDGGSAERMVRIEPVAPPAP